MPAVSTILMAAGTAYQAINAMGQAKDAENAAQQAAFNAARINNEQANMLADLKVPTLGLNLAQQNIQARQQADVQALKEAGAAGVLGGLTGVNQQAQAEDLQLAAQADQMAYQRDMAVKQQAQAVQDAKLNRAYDMEMNRLAGAQQARAASQNALNQSIGSAAQILGDIDTMKIYKGEDPLKLWGNKGAKGVKGAAINEDAIMSNRIYDNTQTIETAPIAKMPVGLTAIPNVTIERPKIDTQEADYLNLAPGQGVMKLPKAPSWKALPFSPASWMGIY